MGAAMSVGTARYALGRAVSYAGERTVWDQPIGAHQGIAHPLAQVKIEIELAALMMQKAATLYDAGDDKGAGEAANMAKYAAAEASVHAVDQAVQTLGGSAGLTAEFGLAARCWPARASAGSRRSAARWSSTSWRRTPWACPGPTDRATPGGSDCLADALMADPSQRASHQHGLLGQG